jgi:hypothetical protein
MWHTKLIMIVMIIIPLIPAGIRWKIHICPNPFKPHMMKMVPARVVRVIYL